ncbi:T9SS type A sorting domain-containing protein [Fluviicola sp.]|uniref:T9SS type A sorting domain-containing protein n=1 Tax=Fluviicola sp. TaxID=1917219 RepID=UPI003D2C313C
MKQIVTYFAAFVLASSSAYGQATLSVNCYNSDTPFNSFAIDDNVIEYSLCGTQPAFYVAVIDPSTCSAWGTNYNGANPTHSFGNMNEGSCRQRVEYYFVFNADDSLQLAGMKYMIQNIPTGHSVIIYTPISYDYNAVNAVNTDLIQELENRWSPWVIHGSDIMILYSEQGNANSYVEETTQNNGQISFSTTICNSSLSLNKNVIDDKLLVKQDGTTFTLNPDLSIDNLQILDAMGKEVSFVKSENTIQLQTGISAGVYVFQATASGKTYRSKQLVSFE